MIDLLRFARVPSAEPIGRAVGSILDETIDRKIQKKALRGDRTAQLDLAHRNPARSRELGSILIDERKEAEHQRLLQEQKDTKQKDMFGRIAQGYINANDKAGFMKGAVQNLIQSGDADFMELSEVLQTMPGDQLDSQMMAAISQFTNIRPNEDKVGRHRIFHGPDGSVHMTDTAQGTTKLLIPSEPVDLSIIPENLREEIAGLPREAQLKAVNEFAKFSTQKTINESNKERESAATNLTSVANSFASTLGDPDIGTATGLSGAVQGEIGRKTGSKSGILRGRLARNANKLILEAASALKGALSDKDVDFLKSILPSKNDHPNVWVDWYNEEFIPLIKLRAQKKGIDFSTLGIQESLNPISESSTRSTNIGRFKVTVE